MHKTLTVNTSKFNARVFFLGGVPRIVRVVFAIEAIQSEQTTWVQQHYIMIQVLDPFSLLHLLQENDRMPFPSGPICIITPQRLCWTNFLSSQRLKSTWTLWTPRPSLGTTQGGTAQMEGGREVGPNIGNGKQRASLLGARTLLGAPGISIRNKKLVETIISSRI